MSVSLGYSLIRTRKESIVVRARVVDKPRFLEESFLLLISLPRSLREI